MFDVRRALIADIITSTGSVAIYQATKKKKFKNRKVIFAKQNLLARLLKKSSLK